MEYPWGIHGSIQGCGIPAVSRVCWPLGLVCQGFVTYSAARPPKLYVAGEPQQLAQTHCRPSHYFF